MQMYGTIQVPCSKPTLDLWGLTTHPQCSEGQVVVVHLTRPKAMDKQLVNDR